jgi:hypothetical protein
MICGVHRIVLRNIALLVHRERDSLLHRFYVDDSLTQDNNPQDQVSVVDFTLTRSDSLDPVRIVPTFEAIPERNERNVRSVNDEELHFLLCHSQHPVHVKRRMRVNQFPATPANFPPTPENQRPQHQNRNQRVALSQWSFPPDSTERNFRFRVAISAKQVTLLAPFFVLKECGYVHIR